MMTCPVDVSPVNEIRGTSGCVTRAAPAASPMPCHQRVLPPGTNAPPVKLGHYDDQLVREDGRWRFLGREAPTDIG
jgi:hypothetical protein